MKRILKTIIDSIATLLVLPAIVCCRAGVRILGPHQGFAGWSQGMSLLPGLVGVYLRRAFYKRTLAHCGDGACITFGTTFSHPTARIGKDVYVGAFCSLGDVVIEDDVLIASNVSVMNGCRQHGTERLDIPIREQPGTYEAVTIGRDSWIGERAVVAASIGKHCVIGAGAVVTKPIPDYAIAVGVPARVVRYRNTHPDILDRVSATEELLAQT